MNAFKLPSITGNTHLVAIIGNPVRHSVSPATHTLAYKKMGIDSVFLAFELNNDDLPAVMSAFRVMDGWDSITVTMPCKQEIIQYLDNLSPEAELANAVNVVKKEKDGRIIGYNADGAGFINNLKNQNITITNSKITLLGPGGAGSAIAAQAAIEGASLINIFARKNGHSYKEAFYLKNRIENKTECKINIFPFEDIEILKKSLNDSDILANCTNVGMGIGNTETPIPPEIIKPGMIVAEVINTPRETQLLIEAKKIGCKTFSGLGMNDEQSVVADQIRYGITIPIKEIRRELDQQS